MILIGRRNFITYSGATLSGGSWVHPLINLKEINPQYVAESTDNSPASTTFDVDLGAQRTVGAFHFSNLRVSVNGLIRLRAGIDPTFVTNTYATGAFVPGPETFQELEEGGIRELEEGGLVQLEESGSGAESGWIAAWPTDSTPFGYNQWGEFTATGAYAGSEYARLGMTRFFVPPTPIPVRYIRFEVNDTTAEIIRIGVFGAWEVWIPPHNIMAGRSISIIDESVINTIPGGAVHIGTRGIRQRHSFAFSEMPAEEMWLRTFGIFLEKGRSIPLIVIYDPADTNNLEKKSIYGLLSDSPPFTNPYYGIWNYVFQIDQLI